MARGQQKIQAQQKNAEKKKKLAKQKAGGNKDSAAKAFVYNCSVCKTSLTGIKVYHEHFFAKHPKAPVPPELADGAGAPGS